jgi:succinate-semialdehyde dehydrogenase/glutarate-semialdehyde dehydrogenase
VKRLFLHEAIADQFIEGLKVRVESLKVGNGIDPIVDMGPLHSDEQRTKIETLVNQLRERAEGTIITGGTSLVGDEHIQGFFYAPTLVTEVEPSSPILTEEVFGPVLPIMRFSDLDTAIDGANRSRYGLGASVWTENIDVIRTVFRRVKAGFVWVNRHYTVPPELPFGGIKESGLGRENGFQALQQYTSTKSLFLGE